jgi:effector-binding domain-containing protein
MEKLKESKMSVKIACEIMWANDAVEVNKNYNKDNTKYKATIANISEKAKQKLEADYGMKINSDEKKGFSFSAKSKYPFAFVSQGGNTIDAKSIGNGSKAVIEVTGSYDHSFAKRYGKGAVIKGTIVITELVKYEPKGDDSTTPFDADETL